MLAAIINTMHGSTEDAGCHCFNLFQYRVVFTSTGLIYISKILVEIRKYL